MTKKVNTKITKNTPVNFGMLTEATDAILNGMQSMFDEQNAKLDKRFGKVETDIKYMHDSLKKEIDELKYDTPTRKEFTDLKDRFDRYYPTL